MKPTRRNFLRAYQLFMGCDICGWCKFSEGLDFHHISRETKRFNVSDYTGRSWLDLVQEVLKCEVLCARCHRGVEYGKLLLRRPDPQLSVELVENRSGTERPGHAATGDFSRTLARDPWGAQWVFCRPRSAAEWKEWRLSRRAANRDLEIPNASQSEQGSSTGGNVVEGRLA